MEGTNPTDKKTRSHGKAMTSNDKAIDKGPAPQNSTQQGGDKKNHTADQSVEHNEQVTEQEKPPNVVHPIDGEKSEPSSSGGEPPTPEPFPADSHPTATAYSEASVATPNTAEQPATRSAAFSLIEMLTHNNENLRVEAVESLLKIGDKSLSYAFSSAMKDESFRVRLGALRGLYKFGGDSATEYLITALEDKHPDVRRRAVIYLGWMRKNELLPFVTAALADHSSRVRKVAAYALGDIKDISAVPYLMKALEDTDPAVLKAALAALKRITGKSFSDEQQSPEEGQHEIIRKWKKWWQKENK
jgi:HEAT repeat protein